MPKLNKLTQFPWITKQVFGNQGFAIFYKIENGNSIHIKRLDEGIAGLFSESDAKIIAAAPDLLLAALKVDALSIQTSAHKELRNAIHKALG